MQGVYRCSAAAWKSLFRRYNLNVGFPPQRRRSTVVSAATPASNISVRRKAVTMASLGSTVAGPGGSH